MIKINEKQKRIIVFSLFIVLVAILFLIILFGHIFAKNGNKEKEVPLDYGKMFDEYVNEVKRVSTNYYNEKEELPIYDWIRINVYNKYAVSCEEFNIYYPDLIRLKNCTVENSKDKYSKDIRIDKASADNLKVCYKKGLGIEDQQTFYGSCGRVSDIDYVEYKVYCTTSRCNIVEDLRNYVSILEEDQTIHVYDFENNELIYKTTPNIRVEYIFYGDVIGLYLKNALNETAIYNIELKKVVADYGKYQYKDKHSTIMVVDNLFLLKVTLKDKTGAIDFKSGEIVIDIEYDELIGNVYDKNRYIFGVKGKKNILVDARTGEKKLGGKGYSAISYTEYNGGFALVYDETQLMLLKGNGDLLKVLETINISYKYHNSSISRDASIIYMEFMIIDSEEIFECIEFHYNLKTNSFGKTNKKCHYPVP